MSQWPVGSAIDELPVWAIVVFLVAIAVFGLLSVFTERIGRFREPALWMGIVVVIGAAFAPEPWVIVIPIIAYAAVTLAALTDVVQKHRRRRNHKADLT